ncbi:cadherin-23-like [Maniola jurtina]|uniref:cadherin-23-like n=1 Tax=Maniola jurtina TaxID=191418 RepID=UPI001E68EC65|nr:cadherin-23-like [Maniola jurtina]XP_045767242.1 cadherin-23-like [Maniola jurtina]XP_045767243.1 cadherin-23-like [Maniola jurtina]
MGVRLGEMILIAFIIGIPLVAAQDLQLERCAWMTAIPRESMPDMPELDFDGVPWSQRQFLPVATREDVCMDRFISTASTQIILMDEEIEGDVAIAKLNYKGTAAPSIDRMLSGSFSMLGPVLRNENDEWFLYITQKQDYENLNMQRYMLDVSVPGDAVVGRVTLQIVNIDDNAPIIRLLDSCVVPELGSLGLTNCTYEVSDADGRISTSNMTFSIDSERDDDEIFYVQGDNIPNDWYRMTMSLGLNRSLDFTANVLHIFRVTAFDSLPNTHTVTMMVQVDNVEHRPPRWVEVFAVEQFDEKTPMNFSVRAIDADTGINGRIYYTLRAADEDKEFFAIDTIDGGRNGANFQVAAIDRDELEREIFRVTLIAYKANNESNTTPQDVVIIINDINDQAPLPIHKEYTISIPEETPQTLNFDKEFGFHDRDTGENARYSVRIESVHPPGAAEAFLIQPGQGYQRQTFFMTTANHSMLDFEDELFRYGIELQVIATDLGNATLIGVATVHINLINWNDELPIFETSSQNITFEETVGEGYHVASVRATDRDVNDTVVHTLMGNAQQFLRINESTGDIYVSINDAFDYHRQNELLVQVQAHDTLGIPSSINGTPIVNTDTSQLVIQLIDINNTPPSLRLPRGSPQVEENVPEGYIVTRDSLVITATDPDTTADLNFEIVWNSSYATKQGRETDPTEYVGCLDIETSYPDPDNRGSAVGRLVVKEIRYNVTIDFEEFEVLYVTIKVVDKNTVIGTDYDELTFTITIIDMNDNAPEWVENTLNQTLRVRENSASNTIIGSVQATDIDGPLYNQVRYTIFPREDTPKDLVKIDFVTGQIEVDLDNAIDADIPPRDNLYYTVIASDKCTEADPADCPPDKNYFNTEGNITIQIIDTNNKSPMARTDLFNVTVYLYENATQGDEVVVVVSEDLDRDVIYHTVSYQINYAVSSRLRNFFSVELDTGRVFVDYTTDEVLDRDGDEPRHRIFLNLIDNFYSEGDGNRNQNTTEVLLVLLDVNDNAPELPSADRLSWSVSENLSKGSRLDPYIFAPDRDEPNTNNSRVGYEVANLTLLTERDIVLPDLFTAVDVYTDNKYNVSGELETLADLKGFWGTYNIGIRAYDHGEPQQESSEIYQLVIRPYNFHAPVFVFPQNGAVLRFARERAMVNARLGLTSGEFLDSIHATDEDGLEAGQVTFDVSGDDEASEYFQVLASAENQGILMLQKMFTEDVKEFQVSIRATDGGTEPKSLSTVVTLQAVFVPTQGEPTFSANTADVGFVEKEAGLEEEHKLPHAADLKNFRCDGDCHSIYYRIIDGNDEGYFILDASTNVLKLAKALNRSERETHTLRVAASNSRDVATALPGSVLTVTVTVREANPRPIFVRSLYTAGISTLDSVNRELLTVQAVHSEGLPINYTLDLSSMVTDDSLANVRDSAFLLNNGTGVLTLNMQPTASMHGMFEFDVIATDPDGGNDTAAVKIYLISSQNRVFFMFVNALTQVEAHTNFIAQTFSAGFNMTCNIDQVVPATDTSGATLDDVIEVRAHFIRDNAPVSTEVIEDLRSDTQTLRAIQTTLNTELLVLRDFVTGSSPEINADSSRAAVYVLAGLSAVLGLLCLVLLATFICRTRVLNRRLEALSIPKFGSQESGLNRVGLKAPGTNKHAKEGSNPIWNEAINAPDFDAISEASDDSDLIGIEDLPQFSKDYFPPEGGDSIGPAESVATHSNNFGFNSAPLRPEFANKQPRL